MPIFTVPIHEHNDCHTPAGSPEGGQFCSKDGAAGEASYPETVWADNEVAIVRGVPEFGTLGERRYMFSPKQEYFIFGRTAREESDRRLQYEDDLDRGYAYHIDSEHFDTHAEDYNEISGHERVDAYDAHVKGWVNTDANPPVLSFYEPDLSYAVASEDRRAAEFDAIFKAVEQFIKGGADPETVVEGLQHVMDKPAKTTLGAAFPYLFRKKT